MKVLICGDRHWANRELIERKMSMLGPHDVVIQGGARGADTMAGGIALERGLVVEQFNAEWDKYGRAAGPLRNARMLSEGRPDLVWAFHNDIKFSRGTKDMVTRARLAGIPVEVISEFGSRE